MAKSTSDVIGEGLAIALSGPVGDEAADAAAACQARRIGLTEAEIDRLLRDAPNVPVGGIGQKNVGRIAERIVANELESRGYVVRDLNLEGLAANVDLIAVKNGSPRFIQVKGCTHDRGWWFGYGYCTDDHIKSSQAPFFNRHSGRFRADLVVLVCVENPRSYRCLVLPIEVAEAAAQTNLSLFRVKTSKGTDHKPGKVWFNPYITRAHSTERQKILESERQLLMPYWERWDFES